MKLVDSFTTKNCERLLFYQLLSSHTRVIVIVIVILDSPQFSEKVTVTVMVIVPSSLTSNSLFQQLNWLQTSASALQQ